MVRLPLHTFIPERRGIALKNNVLQKFLNLILTFFKFIKKNNNISVSLFLILRICNIDKVMCWVEKFMLGGFLNDLSKRLDRY